MALGGMYDLVGGGFHRYSVDEQWLVPHFEKMLYDNALLAVTYLHGWQVLGKERYREVVEQTVDYMLRELALDGGGLASAQDADTDGVEGLTFTWKRDGERARSVPAHLRGRPLHHPRRARRRAARASCSRCASERPQPARDDKAIASWNGLALAALAECGRVLDRPDWIDAGARLAEFLLGPLSTDDGRLHRTWRDGVAKGTGYLDDYANVANGLYELHVATGELRWLEESNRLARLAVELFGDDENGGFFQTPSDGEQLVVRKKDFDDHPAPSGNSMLAYVLLRLARIYGDDELEERAASFFRLIPHALMRAPSAFGWGARRARPLPLAAPRDRDRRRRPTPRSHAPRSRAGTRRRWSRSARPTTCRCSRARRSSTASRPSTSASASPARRRSPTRRALAAAQRAPPARLPAPLPRAEETRRRAGRLAGSRAERTRRRPPVRPRARSGRWRRLRPGSGRRLARPGPGPSAVHDRLSTTSLGRRTRRRPGSRRRVARRSCRDRRRLAATSRSGPHRSGRVLDDRQRRAHT